MTSKLAKKSNVKATVLAAEVLKVALAPLPPSIDVVAYPKLHSKNILEFRVFKPLSNKFDLPEKVSNSKARANAFACDEVVVLQARTPPVVVN